MVSVTRPSERIFAVSATCGDREAEDRSPAAASKWRKPSPRLKADYVTTSELTQAFADDAYFSRFGFQ